MKSKGHPGFTLIEISIAITIVALLMGGLLGAVALMQKRLPKSSAQLSVENRQQLARYWITRDANSAEDFTTGTGATYGTFNWRDFPAAPSAATATPPPTPVPTPTPTVNTWAIRYYYDSTLKTLMREEKKNNVAQQTFQVAADILQQGDVAFVWNPGQRKVTVTITPTIQEAPAVGDISRAATLVAWLRFEGEGIVSIPAITPVPTPIPGSVTYLISAVPVVLAGTFASGNAASLTTVDTDFYRVDSTAGSPKEVVWTVLSQTITSPTTIGSIQVRWSGLDDKENTAVELFIKTSAGASYDAVADASFTSVVPDVETTFFFFVPDAKVAAINTGRVIYMKVRGVAQATNRLSGNQLVFVVSP